MYSDLKWKIPLILAIILGAVWLSYPLKERISLGLDLQGGMHLVLEVQVEKAVEASLERMADDIKREIENEDLEVDKVSADLEDRIVTLLMVDTVDQPQMEKIMEGYPFLVKKETSKEGLALNFQLTDDQAVRIEKNIAKRIFPMKLILVGRLNISIFLIFRF